MVNFGLLAAEIVSLVWGTRANFNGFRVLLFDDWLGCFDALQACDERLDGQTKSIVTVPTRCENVVIEANYDPSDIT